MDELPTFRYHPDPVTTESLIADQFTCIVCNKLRHYRYDGPIRSKLQVLEPLCPWCIADGTAADTLAAVFTDTWPHAGVNQKAIDIVTKRTPGYTAWQDPVWLNHCADACVYLGRVGQAELKTLPPSAAAAVKESLSVWGDNDAYRDLIFNTLHRDGDITAYLFECTRCGAHLTHVDAN